MDNAPTPCFIKPEEKNEEIKNLELKDKKEFQIEFNNIIYDTILSKTIDNNNIVIQSYQRDNKYNIYETLLNFDDLIKLNKAFKICETIDDAYKIILNKFNEKKIFIEETKDFKIKILYFSLDNIITGEQQKIEIEIKNKNKDSLLVNEFGEKFENLVENVKKLTKENKVIIKELINYKNEKKIMEEKIQKFEEEMNNIKKENENLKREIQLLKSYFKGNKNIDDFNTPTAMQYQNPDPLKLCLKKDISEKAYCAFFIDGTFAVFNSRINNTTLLVYGSKNNSLKIDDIVNEKNIKIIESAHDNNIISIKYFDDEINYRDLILSISCFDKMIKIWDTTNWECISKIISYKEGNKSFASSASLLFNIKEKDINIITSSDSEYDEIKIFSLDGYDIGSIFSSREDKSYFLDVYFDKKENKNYIISGNNKNVKSYDYSKKEIYKKYDANLNNDHMSVKIYENKNEEEINLIESCVEGFICVWNFHNGELLKKIDCCKGIQLRGICIWDDNNIFVGGDDNSIKLIDFKNGKLLKSFKGQSGTICTLSKIFIQELGQCLISGSNNYEQIKLWCE